MDQFKEFFNFDNVGGKIKNFTKWACWISIIVIWVAVGVCVIVSMTDEPYGLGIGAIVGGGILTFTTWVGSWTMYGFGEIVENNMGRNENSNQKEQKHKPKAEQEHMIPEMSSCVSPQHEIGRCFYCQKNPTRVRRYKIEDARGVRYRYACDQCAERQNLRKE